MALEGRDTDHGEWRAPAAGSHVEVVAPAKLNLALLVGPRRRDGYHEVCSLMVPVTLADVVRAEPSPSDDLIVECEVCPGERNLAARAVRELERVVGQPLPALLRIDKRVPHAAGLGGGSADAAAALVALERLYDLRLPGRTRYEVAAAVGSDVPFFLWCGPQLAMGRGTVLSETVLPGPLHFVIVAPEIEVSTAEVYRWWDGDEVVGLRAFAERTQVLVAAARAARRPPDLAPLVANDLEPCVVARWPEVGQIRDTLMEAGALAAAMSGSGAAVFGLFADAEGAEAARLRILARLEIAPGRAFTVSELQSGPLWKVRGG